MGIQVSTVDTILFIGGIPFHSRRPSLYPFFVEIYHDILAINQTLSPDHLDIAILFLWAGNAV